MYFFNIHFRHSVLVNLKKKITADKINAFLLDQNCFEVLNNFSSIIWKERHALSIKLLFDDETLCCFQLKYNWI